MNGPSADVEQIGDFLVGLAFAEQGKNFVLALGQGGQCLGQASCWQTGNRGLKIIADPVGDGFTRKKLRRRWVEWFEDSGWQRAAEEIAGSAARRALE